MITWTSAAPKYFTCLAGEEEKNWNQTGNIMIDNKRHEIFSWQWCMFCCLCAFLAFILQYLNQTQKAKEHTHTVTMCLLKGRKECWKWKIHRNRKIQWTSDEDFQIYYKHFFLATCWQACLHHPVFKASRVDTCKESITHEAIWWPKFQAPKPFINLQTGFSQQSTRDMQFTTRKLGKWSCISLP